MKERTYDGKKVLVFLIKKGNYEGHFADMSLYVWVCAHVRVCFVFGGGGRRVGLQKDSVFFWQLPIDTHKSITNKDMKVVASNMKQPFCIEFNNPNISLSN